MWIELLISAPSAFVAYKGRHIAVKGFRKVPLIKSALPAPPVQKPTMILCELLALEIIKDIPNVQESGRQEWSFKGHRLAYRTDYHYCDGTNRYKMAKNFRGGHRKWWLEFLSVTLHDPVGNSISLDGFEIKILEAALAKAADLYGKKRSITAEESRQTAALEAIEHIMGITPKLEDKS